jgi:hypothetical protein
MILSDDNVVIYRHKFLLCTVKNQLCNPSKTRALDFKREIPRLRFCLVPITIEINRPTFLRQRDQLCPTEGKSTVNASSAAANASPWRKAHYAVLYKAARSLGVSTCGAKSGSPV